MLHVWASLDMPIFKKTRPSKSKTSNHAPQQGHKLQLALLPSELLCKVTRCQASFILALQLRRCEAP